MIGRILWLAALLSIAVITTSLQFDRQSEAAPQIAPLAPAPFCDYAHAYIVAAALERDDPAAALDAAKELVRRRPMPAEHLTLLAAAQAKAGKPEAAVFTIQLAGQRGWRERVAQETLLRLALVAGDKAEAARRYAALFRSNATADELLIEFAPKVLGKAGGAGQVTFAAHPCRSSPVVRAVPPARREGHAARDLRRDTGPITGSRRAVRVRAAPACRRGPRQVRCRSGGGVYRPDQAPLRLKSTDDARKVGRRIVLGEGFVDRARVLA